MMYCEVNDMQYMCKNYGMVNSYFVDSCLFIATTLRNNNNYKHAY